MDALREYGSRHAQVAGRLVVVLAVAVSLQAAAQGPQGAPREGVGAIVPAAPGVGSVAPEGPEDSPPGPVEAGAQVLLFDTETTRVIRSGRVELTRLEATILPPALGVAPEREQCAGQDFWLTPRSSSRAFGRFVGDGARQTLVSVRFRRCDDRDAPTLPGALVLYQGASVLSVVPTPVNVLAVRDVDSDGVDEVVLLSREFGRGSLIERAAAWSFSGAKATLVHDFGIVHFDYCGTYLQGDAPVAHTRVTFTAGPEARFDVVGWTEACPR